MSPQYLNHGGYYGNNSDFGGQYVPEILLPALKELEQAFHTYKDDPEFLAELTFYQKNLIGRPSPIIFAKNLTEQIGGAKIYLKNEGNNLSGSHKINHCLYQALLAKRMNKTEIIVETGAGQHGLASAMVCAKFNMVCRVHMGTKDISRQYPNVFFMKQVMGRSGSCIVPVSTGTQTLTAAVDSAIGDWIGSPEAYYMLGSCVGPYPYPEIMREAQKIISKEMKTQMQELENVLPDVIVACAGGGSNATGSFDEFLDDKSVRLVAVEAAGKGLDVIGNHSSKIASGMAQTAVMEGFKSYFLVNKDGQVMPTQNISAGLDYVGISPFLSYLHSIGRIEVAGITDAEVLETFQLLASTEGLLVALESCHAVAQAIKIAKTMTNDKTIVVNLSGRADNYLFNIAKGLQDKEFEQFCQDYNEK